MYCINKIIWEWYFISQQRELYLGHLLAIGTSYISEA